VLGNLVRRAIDIAVLFLAVYAFAFVPLGNRTGLEHCRAILHTRAAREAGRDIAGAADRLRNRIMADDTEAVPARGAPVVPALPRHPHAPREAILSPAAPLDAPDASM
jgi:hypothetical protein